MVIKTSALEDRHPDQNKIPWLAGQDWLRFMAAVVDIAEQKIVLKTIGAEAPLQVDHTGHLVVAVDDFPSTGWPQGKVATRDDYAGVLWATGKAYTATAETDVASQCTHIYNPEDDPINNYKGEFLDMVPCVVPGDYWQYSMDNHQVYVRHHLSPRTTRFHPQDSVDGPEPRELQPLRVTFKDGFNTPFVDIWDDKVNEPPWTGFTIFVGVGCDPKTRLDNIHKPHSQEGVHVQLGHTRVRVHPKSLKPHVSKRLNRSMDVSLKPPDLPMNRAEKVFKPKDVEFPFLRTSGSSETQRNEKVIPETPRFGAGQMEADGAQPPEVPGGDGALRHCQQGRSGDQVPFSSTDGLCGGDHPAGDGPGSGLATEFATGINTGEGTDSTCRQHELPHTAREVPPSGGTWKALWERTWQVPGMRQLWQRLEGPGLPGAHHPGEGDDVQDLRGITRTTRRQGDEGSAHSTGFFYKILCLLIFLTTNVYGYGSGLRDQHYSIDEHYATTTDQGEGQGRAHPGRGEPTLGGGRRGDEFRGRSCEEDYVNEPFFTKQKLKAGQKKRMQSNAHEALNNSKLHRRLVQQRLQNGKWPRRHFKFDFIEIFGGTSMVSIRGATLWRMKVLQPIDIRFGIDLRKRAMRRWLLKLLQKTNPRLAMVEYPCTVWSILQSNVNYLGREEELKQLREADRPFLRLTEDIFESQTRRKAHAIAENPATAQSQKEPEILRLREKFFETTACLCMYGLTGKNGLPMQKRVRFIATHRYFVEDLDRQCDGSHPHEKVEGQNTKASACYPPDLADTICRSYWRIVEEEVYGTFTYAEPKPIHKTAWFVDVDKQEDKWRPLLAEAEEVLARKVQGSIFVAPDSELYKKICDLVPWQVMNIQIAHLPKAKRLRPGLEDCHRASVMLLNDNSITIETEYLKTAQAPRERFVTPVRVAIFGLGYAPGEPAAPAPMAEREKQVVFAPEEEALLPAEEHDKVVVRQAYGETWFTGPPLTNKQKKLAPTIVKLHKNLGHPSQPDLTRALVQAGHVETEAIELSRRLKCAVCERSRRPKTPRPTSFKIIGSFNSKLCMDFVYVADINGDNFQFLHILEPNGSFNVFYPCPTREPGAVYDLFTLLWASWAGFPQRLWVDKDGAFEGEFLEKLRAMGTVIDNPPAEAHWQAGEVEAYNRAFKDTSRKLIDEMALIGERDMRTMACAVAAAMNDRIRSSGCSAYQWVFGKSPQIPDDILSPDGKFEALQAMELDDELRKRARIRALADEKIAAYRLNEAVRTAILRKSHPIKENYQPGDLIAFWREAKYKQGKKGQKGKRIPASWYRGIVIGPHKGDDTTKQNNFWVTSNGRCVVWRRNR